MEKHNFNPVYDDKSKILILGSFPSVKSREMQFFYGHPQNRFWMVISSVCGCECPDTVEAKKRMLLENHIALWDVIAQCDITGSSDSSIKNVQPNDFSEIFKAADIKQVFCNGGTSYKMYEKYCESAVGMKAVRLPSTSPANAAFSVEKLTAAWQIIKDYI